MGGHITGNVKAAEALAIEAGAVVVGDIVTPRLIIEDGAIRPAIHMASPAAIEKERS